MRPCRDKFGGKNHGTIQMTNVMSSTSGMSLPERIAACENVVHFPLVRRHDKTATHSDREGD